MASFEGDLGQLRQAVRSKLHADGTLSRVKAELRKAVFEVLDQDRLLSQHLSGQTKQPAILGVGGLTSSPNGFAHPRATGIRNSTEAKIAVSLALDLCDALGCSSARSVLLSESGLDPQEIPSTDAIASAMRLGTLQPTSVLPRLTSLRSSGVSAAASIVTFPPCALLTLVKLSRQQPDDGRQVSHVKGLASSPETSPRRSAGSGLGSPTSGTHDGFPGQHSAGGGASEGLSVSIGETGMALETSLRSPPRSPARAHPHPIHAPGGGSGAPRSLSITAQLGLGTGLGAMVREMQSVAEAEDSFTRAQLAAGSDRSPRRDGEHSGSFLDDSEACELQSPGYGRRLTRPGPPPVDLGATISFSRGRRGGGASLSAMAALAEDGDGDEEWDVDGESGHPGAGVVGVRTASPPRPGPLGIEQRQGLPLDSGSSGSGSGFLDDFEGEELEDGRLDMGPQPRPAVLPSAQVEEDLVIQEEEGEGEGGGSAPTAPGKGIEEPQSPELSHPLDGRRREGRHRGQVQAPALPLPHGAPSPSRALNSSLAYSASPGEGEGADLSRVSGVSRDSGGDAYSEGVSPPPAGLGRSMPSAPIGAGRPVAGMLTSLPALVRPGTRLAAPVDAYDFDMDSSSEGDVSVSESRDIAESREHKATLQKGAENVNPETFSILGGGLGFGRGEGSLVPQPSESAGLHDVSVEQEEEEEEEEELY